MLPSHYKERDGSSSSRRQIAEHSFDGFRKDERLSQPLSINQKIKSHESWHNLNIDDFEDLVNDSYEFRRFIKEMIIDIM